MLACHSDERVPGMKGSGFVTSRTRKLGLAILCCGVVLAPATWAFFPIGAYDSAGVLRYKQYNRSFFDTNNDGVVDEDEGVPVYIEDGKSGFNDGEIDIVEEALAVWERVPQSYASTYVVGMVQDPIFTGLDNFDTLNVIAMQVTETQDLDGDGQADEDVVPDPGEVLVPGLTGGVIGVNVTFWAAEETVIQSGTDTVLVSSGQIIDNDIIINASMTRPPAAGEEPLADLMATMVHEIGHFYGLDHTALNNLAPDLAVPGDPSSILGLVESQVLSHSIAGVSRRIGVTPTMYPTIFDVIDGNGARSGGGSDLAPDDISGVAWLYPRGSQDLFFNLTGEVRTRTNPGTALPSAPVPGAHIVAWADVDNDETTPRVAVFSTLSALYVNSGLYPEREGRFELPYMWKQMETESGVFGADYTFSSNPLNFTGFDRQAPPQAIQNPDTLDSILPPTAAFNNVFPSEVLHEVDNIIDISNKDAGTPFVWDYQRETLISKDTERTISAIVGDNPMFGDPNDVCIFNVVSGVKAGADMGGVAGVVTGANSVRSIRDGILMETALGSFIVDTYYRISPTLARFMLGNGTAYSLTAAAVGAIYWCLDNVLVLAGALLAGAWVIRRRRRVARAAAALAVTGALLFGIPAHALLLYQTTDDLIANSSDIVSGTVTSVVSRQETPGSQIFTDVVIEITDRAKGTLNKQSSITITQLGGRVGGLISEVSDLAQFTQGESVVVHLTYVENLGYQVYNGEAGKVSVSGAKSASDEDTVAISADLQARIAKSLPAGAEVPATMTLTDYMAELRAIARDQEAAEEQ